MAYLVGIDEAGYGPFLGPLCIAATLWQIPDEQFSNDFDLYEQLAQSISTSLADKSRIMIGDSKKAYKPKSGLQNLERAVHTFAGLLHKSSDFSDWMQHRAVEWSAWSAQSPWFHGYRRQLPVDADTTTLERLQRELQQTLSQTNIRFVDAKVMCIPAARFNHLLQSFASKGELLSHCSLELVRLITANHPAQSMLVHCDKHGGRNHYSHLLQQIFPDYLVEIHEESRAISRYYFGPEHRRTQFRFVAKGESFLPTALASMYAKYTRELTMHAFNQFWQQSNEGLKPTAGYPQDARRFKLEIAEQQQQLHIDDNLLWRNR